MQIVRILQDEKGQRMIHSFCEQWLNLRSFNKVTPSLKLYPWLPLETEAYLDHLVQENLCWAFD
jgi:hypothetical protein